MPIKKAAGLAGSGLKVAGKVVMYSILGVLAVLLWLLFMPAGSLKVAVLSSVVFFGGRYLVRKYKAKGAARDAEQAAVAEAAASLPKKDAE